MNLSRSLSIMKYNDLIPELAVSNYEKSLHFYSRLLSFKIEYSRPEDGFAFLSLADSQLMIEQTSEINAASQEEIEKGNWRTGSLEYPFGRGINFSIRVESVNEVIAVLKQEGYPIKMGPKEVWYRRDNMEIGERQILVMDPDGYLLRFQEPLGERRI